MKKEKIKRILLGASLLAILFLILSPTAPALAEEGDNYQLLAPLLDLKELETDNILKEYVPFVFKLAVGIAAVFAVLMIVLGGIQYMSTDALQGKEDGKKRVTNAIKGLILVIAAWLILYTINPNLLKFDLSISPVEVKAPPAVAVTPGIPMMPSEILESNRIRGLLEDLGIYYLLAAGVVPP